MCETIKTGVIKNLSYSIRLIWSLVNFHSSKNVQKRSSSFKMPARIFNCRFSVYIIALIVPKGTRYHLYGNDRGPFVQCAWLLCATVALEVKVVKAMGWDPLELITFVTNSLIYSAYKAHKPLWWINSQWQWLICTISLPLFFVFLYEINYIDTYYAIHNLYHTNCMVLFYGPHRASMLNPAFQLSKTTLTTMSKSTWQIIMPASFIQLFNDAFNCPLAALFFWLNK